MADQVRWQEKGDRTQPGLGEQLGDFPIQNLRTLGGLVDDLPCGVAIVDLDNQRQVVSSNRAWRSRDSGARLPPNLTSSWTDGKASPCPGWDLYPVLGRPSHVLIVDSEGIEREASKPSLLSPREGEIADLVAAGHSNAEIARRLFLSPATVASHIGRILEKLGFRSRVQIGVWASRGVRPGRP